MKLTQWQTHWSADEAHMILDFLDDLKELVWSAYGEEIIAHHQRQLEFPFDECADDHDEEVGQDDEFNDVIPI